MIHQPSHPLILQLLLAFTLLVPPVAGFSRQVGDFQLSQDQASIPIDEIHSGGPPKDGIPAIDAPRFLGSKEPGTPQPDDRVLGLEWEGVTKAYPISIMNWHEIVNDQFARHPVVITYCPLCGSGVAFSAQVGDERLEFGVSGLLYNSDVLLYDRKTESLWSQILARAVTGKMDGTRLKVLPLMLTTWSEWQQLHPDTLVLSRQTGYSRDYERDPYVGYESSEGVYFPVKRKDPRFHPKEEVFGLEVDGQFKAYPVAALSGAGEEIRDRFAGQDLIIRYNPESRSARFFDLQQREIPVIRAYWFAWYAFHPETRVFKP